MARILIIDDNTTMSQMLREALELSGYEVVEASNGEEGLDLCRQHDVGLIITDLFMPKKDGLEAITELQSEFPETRIIAVTAHGEDENYDFLRVARALGARRTFQKPFDLEEMRSAVRDLLDEDR